MRLLRPTSLALAIAVVAAAVTTGSAGALAPPSTPAGSRTAATPPLPAKSSIPMSPAALTPAATGGPLTNLAHLGFLTDRVAPPRQAGHTTYDLGGEPQIGVVWVYADRQPDGSFRRVGGGAYDAPTGTYGQGAYDADDVTRAAVVYLRHWRQFADAFSREQAYQLLRGVAYFQTATGPDAGNVVLWMQPGGTLNPRPTPTELPDPSDSGPSYWLARTLWALGEGYAAFRSGTVADRAFAAFLGARMRLSIAALRRETLIRYGKYRVVDGVRRPAWLVVDGADASSEAVLGLSAYVRAGGGPGARTALRQLARGIAELGAGSRTRWPYGALLPSARTNSIWHAWGAQMTGALAQAAATLRDRRLLRPVRRDAAMFTPGLLASYGPVSGLLPAPVDRTQIAYGADARLQGLLAAARVTRSRGLSALAGVAAGWYFGQNPAGRATYDPSTGVTADGVSPDGVVNQNSGAESTIHGLLSMLALDAHPAVARAARRSARVVARIGQQSIEAETAVLGGGATVRTPVPAYSDESVWSGGKYVRAGRRATLTWTLPSTTRPLILEAVVNRVRGRGGRVVWAANGRRIGARSTGGLGAQGVSAVPGQIVPLTVAHLVPAGTTTLTARITRGRASVDAVLLTPVVSRLTAAGSGHRTTLLASRSADPTSRRVRGARTAVSCRSTGRCVAAAVGREGRVRLPPGGFAVVRG